MRRDFQFYTGVGSRETPDDIGEIMSKVALKLEKQGFVLRSGGAQGADTFFAREIENKEIFIPWRGFIEDSGAIIPPHSKFADQLVREAHPAYERLKQGALKLHLRNVNQVLGQDLKTPSKFLICWANVDGKGVPKGGTRTAWMIAKKFNIPCFNLIFTEHLERFKKFIET